MDYRTENTPKSLFESKEHYLKFIKSFKESSKTIHLSSYHFLIYSLLRDKDWRKGFTSVTNKNKIECQGRKPNDTVNRILNDINRGWLTYEYLTIPFGDTINRDMLKKAISFLPKEVKETVNA